MKASMPRAESDTNAKNTAQVDLLFRDLLAKKKCWLQLFITLARQIDWYSEVVTLVREWFLLLSA